MDLTKRMTKELIEMYRDRECLWLVSSEDYRKKNLRMKAYQEIVDFLKSNGIRDATDTLVRERIQNMRRSVRKEKCKIENSNGTYKTNLWYYDILDFAITQNDKPAPSKVKKMKLEVDDYDTDHSSNNQVSTKDPLYEDNSLAEVETHLEVTETGPQVITAPGDRESEPIVKYVRNPDEFEALGISIAAKVRRMDAEQKIHAELLIQKVLAKGLLGQLNENMELVDLTSARLQNHPADGSNAAF